jgi:tRNA dimethylallyltransferase
MKSTFTQLAIIGTTASGKTSLAITIAKQTNSIILSLDSLAVFKEINIASAKPTLKERAGILHFGIDEVSPNNQFDVSHFLNLYKKAKQYAINNKKNLIIVGGTGFYLKALVDGISYLPVASNKNKKIVNEKLKNIQEAYLFLNKLDTKYMENIKSNDKYRIEKALTLYFTTNKTPTDYFRANPKEPLAANLPIFEIVWDKEILKKRIAKRTNIMIKDGIIDEVIYLEKAYTRTPSCMATIGISETLDYLDNKLSKTQLEEKITQNTIKLAKNQRTFNNGQFSNIRQFNLENIKNQILLEFDNNLE